MLITKSWDIDLYDFEAWSGAVGTLEYLTQDDCRQLESILEDDYTDGIDETTLNDILWFEDDWIAEMLGFSCFDALMFCREHEDETVWECDNDYFTAEDMRKEYDRLVTECEEKYEDYKEDYASLEEYMEDVNGWSTFDEFIENSEGYGYEIIQEGE